MLGHQQIQISGPCFAPSDTVELTFDPTHDFIPSPITVPCMLENSATVTCIMPTIFYEGYIYAELIYYNADREDGTYGYITICEEIGFSQK